MRAPFVEEGDRVAGRSVPAERRRESARVDAARKAVVRSRRTSPRRVGRVRSREGLGELVVAARAALVAGRELRWRVAALREHLETERAVCARVLVVIPQAVHAARRGGRQSVPTDA